MLIKEVQEELKKIADIEILQGHYSINKLMLQTRDTVYIFKDATVLTWKDTVTIKTQSEYKTFKYCDVLSIGKVIEKKQEIFESDKEIKVGENFSLF